MNPLILRLVTMRVTIVLTTNELEMEAAVTKHLKKVKNGIAKKRVMEANRRVIDGADAMIGVYIYKVTQAIIKKRALQVNE
jgi:hypothetical protein